MMTPNRRPRTHRTRRLETRRGASLLAAALALTGAVLPGCADDATERPPPLYSVAERGLPWQPLHLADSAPLSISWAFDTPGADRGEGTWTPAAGTQHRLDDGTLDLTGNGSAAIVGPGLNPEIQHHITMRLRARDVSEVQVQWRSQDEGFHAARTYKHPLEDVDKDGFQTVAIPVSSLRGSRHLLPPEPGDPPNRQRWSKARDAAEGVDALRIAFVGQGPVRVQLDELHILSDFDRPEIGSQRLGRLGIYMLGSVVRSGDSLTAEVTPFAAERLRMRLAVAGADSPATVRLRSRDGALPEQAWTLQPGGDWVDAAVDLSPLDGRTSHLELLTEGGGDTAVVMVGGVVRMAPAEVRRPSIILYLVDTLRADRLGTYGYQRDTDPALQAIAEEGVVFENTFAASNWTRPATSSVHTSLDTITHGNNSHLNRVSPHVETLAEQLAENGYLTISFVTNFNASEWAGLEQGMDVWCDPPAYGAVHAADSLTSRLIGPPIREFLEEHRDEQVFVYAHSGDPHLPYDPPPGLMERLARGPRGSLPADAGPDVLGNSDRYDAEILFNDGEIGLIDDTLQSIGRKDDTVFAFISDHGEGFGEHGTFEHRKLLYQEELHVPLVLRWPEAIPPGQRHAEPVGQIDLAPTLLGLVGGEIPPSWQGRDLSDALRSGGAVGIDQQPLLAHVLHSAPRDGLHDEIAVIWGDYKLIAGVTPEGAVVPRSLHDLAADPDETRDLLGAPEAADVQRAATAWAERRVAASREAALPSEADAMDPAKRQWMIEMGYL